MPNTQAITLRLFDIVGVTLAAPIDADRLRRAILL
jgi:hypothetical protein